jgi:hypothetical protein
MADLWVEEFTPKGHCMICGNTGVIDTIGKVFTPAGFECGGRALCICPNGRIMKKKGVKV